jgi:serine/threonine protein kinase
MDTLGPGSVVSSRYEVLSLLGTGGMGAVFKARDLVLDVVVALKVLSADLAQYGATVADRFLSEIRLARRIRHINVCGIHEYGQDGPIRYIAMEFVDGADLSAIIRAHGRLEAEIALEIAVQACRGLGAIHEAGVIHRDLKPSNIMIDSEGRVRLMDFGVAKRSGDELNTQAGFVVGSPMYMSPEQAKAQPVDARTDIYGLGIVLYEMLAGVPPFAGTGALELLIKHVSEAAPVDDPRIPPSVRPVLERVLAKSKDERPASAAELERELAALTAGGDRRAALAELATVQRRKRSDEGAQGAQGAAVTSTSAPPSPPGERTVSDDVPGPPSLVRPLAEVDGFTEAIRLPLQRQEEAARIGLSRTNLSRPAFERTKVFICYRQEDSSDVSGRIHDHLVGALGSDSVFKDVDSIPLGANFKTYLESVVNSCLLQLVVIGRQWLDVRDEGGDRRLEDASDWVRIEIEAALARDIPVIPLLVQGASMPKPRQLPPSLQELAYLHGAAIRRDPGFKDDMQRLIGSLGALLSRFGG